MGNFDPSPIYNGLSSLGDSVKEIYGAKKESDFFTQKIEDLAKIKDPNTGQPLLDPETVQKAYGKSLSAKKAIVADAAFQHQDALDTRAYNAAQGWHGDSSAQAWAGLEPWQPTPEAISAAKDAGYIYAQQSRHGGSYLPVKATGAGVTPALGTDPTGTGNFYYDGGRLAQVREPSANVPTSAAQSIDMLLGSIASDNTAIAAKNKEIAEHQAAIDSGDHRYGFGNIFSRKSTIADLNKEKQAIVDRMTGREDQIKQIRSTFRAEPVKAPAAGGTKPKVQASAPVAAPADPLPASAGEGNDGPGLFDPNAVGPDPAAPKPAMAGYKVGVKYSGMKYLGGDPGDMANWEK